VSTAAWQRWDAGTGRLPHCVGVAVARSTWYRPSRRSCATTAGEHGILRMGTYDLSDFGKSCLHRIGIMCLAVKPSRATTRAPLSDGNMLWQENMPTWNVTCSDYLALRFARTVSSLQARQSPPYSSFVWVLPTNALRCPNAGSYHTAAPGWCIKSIILPL
jgi:hypothetical protein